MNARRTQASGIVMQLSGLNASADLVERLRAAMRRTESRPEARAETTGPRRFWDFTAAADAGAEDTLWVYDQIGFDFWGEGVTAASFAKELGALKSKKLTVRINSPGGDVFDGLAIKNLLIDHPASITVKVDGLAASIASVIAQAGDKIIMGANSQMMIHDASGGGWGNASDLRDIADLLELISDNIADVYAKRAGGDPKEWRKTMKGERWYSADEAVAAGLADEVAPAPERPEPESATAQAKRYRNAARWCRDLFPEHRAEAARYDAAAEALEAGAELERDLDAPAEDAPAEDSTEAPAGGPATDAPSGQDPASTAPATPVADEEGDDQAPSSSALDATALGDVASTIRAAVAPLSIDIADWRSYFTEAPAAPDVDKNAPVDLGPPAPRRPESEEPEPPARNLLAEIIGAAVDLAATNCPEPDQARADASPHEHENDPPFRLDVSAFRRAVRESRF